MNGDAELAGFRSELHVREYDQGIRGLLQPLWFYSARHRCEFGAQTGYRSNYLSTPRVTWWLFPRDGDAKRPAVIHDAGYTASLTLRDGRRVALIKPLADALFLEAMIAIDINPVQRQVMYAMVRAFGGRPYHGLAQPVPPPQSARVIRTLPGPGDSAWA